MLCQLGGVRVLRNLRKLAFSLVAGVALLLCAASITSAAPDAPTGSLLFYNLYISNSTSSQTQDTRLSITNTSTTTDIAVHLFLVDTGSCSVADMFICLTRNQTATFRASDMDPDIQGYMMAVAVDNQGQPTQFNYLLGTAYIKQASGHQGSLPAVSFRKNSAGSVPSPNGYWVTLLFDGTNYDQMPQQVAVDDFPSQVTDDTRLVIYRPQQNFLLNDTTSTNLFFIIHDDHENSYSATKLISCYSNARILFRNTVATTNQPPNKVLAGTTGWMTIIGLLPTASGAANVPLLGATLNLGTFIGSRNLTPLSFFPSYSIDVPIFPPNC